MKLQPNINNIICLSSFHIRNIGKICKFFNVINAFVTSRLDNDNALLYSLPNNRNIRCQHHQNTTARIVTLSDCLENITPILKHLHWLLIFH